MSKPLVHFLHGKESGPWGSKISRLAEIVRDQGGDADSLDYSGMNDPSDRVRTLVSACESESRPLILVGSSMGGWVATAASNDLKPLGLFLLAPAFYLPGYPDIDPVCEARNMEVVHGWNDEVIPYENSVRFGKEHNCTVHLVSDNHRLSERLDLVADYFDLFLNRIFEKSPE